MWTIKSRNSTANDERQPEAHYRRDIHVNIANRNEKAKVEYIKQHISNLKKTKESLRVIWNPQDSQQTNEQDQQQEPVEFRKTVHHWADEQSDKLAPVFSPYKEKSKRRYSQNPTVWALQDSRCKEERFLTQPKEQNLHKTQQNFRMRQRSLAFSPRSKSRIAPSAQKRIIKTKSIKQMVDYTKGIQILKQLYDIVSEVTFAAKNCPTDITKLAKKYVHHLFSRSLTFIDSFINRCEIKLRKVLLQSRIMENISIVYILLEILKNSQQSQQANLVNFVGHCASNLILLSRLYILAHKKNLSVFPDNSFEACISMFQISTFKEQLHSISNVARRIQHNNEIVGLLQVKTGRLNHRFSLSTRKLLRNLDKFPNSSWLMAHHLFQYLAFYINDIGLNGKLAYLDCAPSPYINQTLNPAQHRYTVLLEPHGVLFLYQKDKIAIRSFSRQFFEYAQKHFEFIIWTWMMPAQIEPVIKLISPQNQQCGMLYRYHCKYVIHVTIQDNKMYSKDLNRLGRNLDTTLIIDYDSRIYDRTPDNGIELPWDGKPGDSKLLDLTQILLEMLTNNMSVKDTLQIYCSEVQSLKTSSRQNS